MKYEIHHFTMCDGWTNTWTITNEDGTEEKEQFNSYQDALDCLRDFLEQEDESYFNGDIESRYQSDEFQIVEVSE
jgi:hypothetical protein